jgi:hypothetical protein
MAVLVSTPIDGRDTWMLGYSLGERLMVDLLALRGRSAARRHEIVGWIEHTLAPSLEAQHDRSDAGGMRRVGDGLARAALDVGDRCGGRTRAAVLLLEICGSCHHLLGYVPDLVLRGTGRAARIELADGGAVDADSASRVVSGSAA